MHRLDKVILFEDFSQTTMRDLSLDFELSSRMVGKAYTGNALIHQFVGELGLVEAIDQRLHLFKMQIPCNV